MTLTDMRLARHEAQARISSIQAEKEFLQRLLSLPLDVATDKIKARLINADAQIRAEQKYINSLETGN